MHSLEKKDSFQLDGALKLILACNWTPDIQTYESSTFMAETMK